MNYPISACILQPGSVKCPDAWAAQQIDAYEEAHDTRECTACGCAGSPTCNADGKYEIFDIPLCEGRLHTEVSETMCTSVADLFDSATGSALPTLATVAQPECTGGEPTGDLQVTGHHTICCR